MLLRIFAMVMFLSLTGNSLADTTGNQLDEDHEEGFLDGVYAYPEIHSHQSIGLPNDPFLYTGATSGSGSTATQTIDVSIPEGNDLDAIDWSVDVSIGSYVPNDNGQGLTGNNSGADQITINLDFMDSSGSVLDSSGPGTFTTTYTDGGWHTYSGTQTDYLADITSLAFTIGGIDSQGMGDGIRFGGMEVTYDYSETPIPIIIEEEILEDIIEMLLDEGVPEELIEEMFVSAEVEDEQEEEEAQEEEAQESEESDESEEESEESEEESEEEADEEETEEESEEEAETEEVEEEAAEEKEEKAEKEEKKEDAKSEKSDSKQSSSSSSTGNNTSINTNSLDTSTAEGALELLDMLSSINSDTAMAGLTDSIDFSAYTGQSLSDAVELEDQEDWYQNQTFYEDQGMSDSSILDGYDKLQLKEGKFYGSNNKLY